MLAGEGVLPAGHHGDQALFLLTVVDGLAIARALPSEVSPRRREAMVLGAAVEAVLHGEWSAGRADPAG